MKDELAKRNPHRLVQQRKRQMAKLQDRMGRVGPLASVLAVLKTLDSDLLAVQHTMPHPSLIQCLAGVCTWDRGQQHSFSDATRDHPR